MVRLGSITNNQPVGQKVKYSLERVFQEQNEFIPKIDCAQLNIIFAVYHALCPVIVPHLVTSAALVELPVICVRCAPAV